MQGARMTCSLFGPCELTRGLVGWGLQPLLLYAQCSLGHRGLASSRVKALRSLSFQVALSGLSVLEIPSRN